MVGDEEFQKLTMKNLQKFDSREGMWDNFDFFGCNITSKSNGEFFLSQLAYISTIRLLSKEKQSEQIRIVRSAFLWEVKYAMILVVLPFDFLKQQKKSDLK